MLSDSSGLWLDFIILTGLFLWEPIALLVTIFYTFLPCFLFVFIGAPWIAKSGESQLIRSVLKFITAAVVAAILQLTVFLVRGVLFPAGSSSPNLWAAVWIIGAFLVVHLTSQRMSRKPDRLSPPAQ